MYQNFLKILTLSLLSGISFNALALEENKPYVRADLGYSMPAKKINTHGDDYAKKAKASLLYGLGFGYKYHSNFRADFTVNHRNKYKYSAANSSGNEKQNISSIAFLINGYYDIEQVKFIKPYLMFGMGASVNNTGPYKNITISPSAAESEISGKQKTSFAWQVGIGAQNSLSNNFLIDYGYRYVDLGKVSTIGRQCDVLSSGGFISCMEKNPIKGKLRTHEVVISLIYSFK